MASTSGGAAAPAPRAPAAPETAPLLTLNAAAHGPSIELSSDLLEVRYVGDARNSNDVGSVRTTHPAPLDQVRRGVCRGGMATQRRGLMRACPRSPIAGNNAAAQSRRERAAVAPAPTALPRLALGHRILR